MKRTLGCVLVLFFSFSWAQGYKHFSLDNGLPSKRVYKITQDQKGFIWICTDKGLVKFDGDQFKVFTVKDGLPSNDIWDVEVTRDNKIWFFTKASRLGYIFEDRVFLFNFENYDGIFYPLYQTDKKKIILKNLGSPQNYILEKNQWKRLDEFKEQNKLLHPTVKAWKLFRKKNFIELYLHDNHKKVIDLSRLNPDKEITKVSIFNQINDSITWFLIQYKKDALLYLLNLNDFSLHPYSIKDLDRKIFNLRLYTSDTTIQLVANNYWAEIDKQYNIHEKSDFKINKTWRAFKDKEGNFWISTFSDGVYFILKKTLESEYFFSGKDVRFLKKTPLGIVSSILSDGLFVYDTLNQNFKLLFNDFYPVHDALYLDEKNYAITGNDSLILVKNLKSVKHPFPRAKKIFLIRDTIYLLNYNSILALDRNFRLISKIPLGNQEIAVLFNNKIITGSNTGLYEINMAKKTFTPLYPKQFPYSVLSMEPFKNKMLIGTDGFGLFQWDGIHPPKPVEVAKNEIINDIEVKQNKIWLATQHGVKVYHHTNDSVYFDFTLRKHDGLISDQIVYLKLFNDKLFSSAYSGISITDTLPPETHTIYGIYFKDIRYNGKKIAPDTTFSVPYKNSNNLYLSFGVIDFSGQEHNQVYYRILPFQTRWNEIPGKEITLNNLNPEDYTFEIMVKNPYGETVTKKLLFSVTPLWWQTAWAKTLFGISFLLVFSAILFFFRRYEIKKNNKKIMLQNKMTELELHALRSQMNPHFVFNSLNAIQYYISDENYDQSEAYLIKFARLIRMIFEFTRKKSISLNEEIKLLKSYLTLEKMRFGDKLKTVFKIDPKINLRQFKIPTMLLQPIVENAVNHGIFHKKEPGTIQLEFHQIDEQTIEIIISDDGVGIKKAEEIKRKSLRKHRSRAQEILQERIKLLNLSGKWKVTYHLEDLTQSDEPFSTRVTLKIQKL